MANGDQFDNLNVVPSADEGLISLPPNTNGDNVASQVDIATIGAFNPSGQQVPSSDVAFIQSQLDPLGGQPVAVAGATNELFSPGFNRPLRVGGTSGQLTGSRDIFVAQNNAFPFALLEQRRAAQQAAARKRAADLSKFQFPKAPLSDDPRFNLSLERRANDLIKTFLARAQREFGSSEAALAALTNPNLVQKTQIGREFAESFAALEIMAKEGDQVVCASNRSAATGASFL